MEGYRYENGLGVEIDLPMAIQLYKSENSPRAKAFLGHCYERGVGIEQDIPLAIELYKQAGDDSYAQAYLGTCYRRGVGVEQNVQQAIRLFEASASQNNPFGLCLLGAELNQTYLYEEAAELKCPYGYSLVAKYKHGGKGDEAIRLYELAVSLNDGYAQYALGRIYDTGRGVATNRVTAFDLYHRSAQQRHWTGMIAVAKCYRRGYGVDRSLTAYFHWIKISFVLNPFGTFLNITQHLDEWPRKHLKELIDLAKISFHSQKKEMLNRFENEMERFKKSANYVRLAEFILKEETDCCICLEKLEPADVFVTKCFHVFHLDCVEDQKLLTQCPLCRGEFEEINC